MPKKESDVETWLKNETPKKRKALEKSAEQFDKGGLLNLHVLQGLYAQESSYGTNIKGKPDSDDPAGDFQLDKKTAKDMGLTVSKEKDQRFDFELSSVAAAKYLKILNTDFSKATVLDEKTRTIPIDNPHERLKFAIAAYNAGAAKIAKAQRKAKNAGQNPQEWESAKKFLKAAGAKPKKVKEVQGYVKNVTAYAKEFSEKDGHWRTLPDGRRIFIREKE